MPEIDSLLDLFLDSAQKFLFMQEWIALDLTFSKSELFTLLVVDRYGEMTMSLVADTINAPMSTATGVVERLVKKEYLERIRNGSDRRIVSIRLTEKGRNLVAEWKETLGIYIETIYEELTKEEQQLLFKLIRKIPEILAAGRQKGGTEKAAEPQIKRIEIE